MKKQLVKLTAEQIKTLARVKAESESTQAVLGSVIECGGTAMDKPKGTCEATQVAIADARSHTGKIFGSLF